MLNIFTDELQSLQCVHDDDLRNAVRCEWRRGGFIDMAHIVVNKQLPLLRKLKEFPSLRTKQLHQLVG